jgi:4a-hydroxytetrahydrobiopterin dehydratase
LQQGVFMSDQGWKAFLATEDLIDWVVLHGGPTAVFQTKTLAAAAELAQVIAQLPGLDGTPAHMSIVSKSLTIRLTREVSNTEVEDIELAREISKIARNHGAVGDPSLVQEVQFAIAAKPDAIDVGFWRAVLGYQPMLDDAGIDPLGLSSNVWMQDLDVTKPLRHAMHIDVSVSKEHAQSRVDAAVAAGGVIVDSSEAPSWWVLADRSGNKVCVVAWPDGAKAKKLES